MFEKNSPSLTGQNRFAYELCKRLDTIIDFRDDISILVPANTTVYPAFKRIKIIMSDKEIKKTENWDWGILKTRATNLTQWH
ncbi:hypothetical protein [Treponema zioleckii]|uniref:hypothetical protein n=1 Tax=Treponema zioleckii TaxID=331680 RepID=UPI00168AA0DF|nr:hypothetical protein [Treponema zioleckii]